VRLGSHDVYFNVAGGLRIQEPAADLAAAAALVSSLTNVPLPPDSVYFGEVSLSGAIRPVAHAGSRLKEATRLGFAGAMAPEAAPDDVESGLKITSVTSLADLVTEIGSLQYEGLNSRIRRVTAR